MGNSPVLYLRFPEDLKPLASEDTHSHPTVCHFNATSLTILLLHIICCISPTLCLPTT